MDVRVDVALVGVAILRSRLVYSEDTRTVTLNDKPMAILLWLGVKGLACCFWSLQGSKSRCRMAVSSGGTGIRLDFERGCRAFALWARSLAGSVAHTVLTFREVPNTRKDVFHDVVRTPRCRTCPIPRRCAHGSGRPGPHLRNASGCAKLGASEREREREPLVRCLVCSLAPASRNRQQHWSPPEHPNHPS